MLAVQHARLPPAWACPPDHALCSLSPLLALPALSRASMLAWCCPALALSRSLKAALSRSGSHSTVTLALRRGVGVRGGLERGAGQEERERQRQRQAEAEAEVLSPPCPARAQDHS
eukprot:2138327-Rhodomonas_salina.1